MQGDRRMRTDLNVKGAVFEFVIGNTLKTNFKQSKLFYDIRIKCRWLRRNETQIDLLLLTEKAIRGKKLEPWDNWQLWRLCLEGIWQPAARYDCCKSVPSEHAAH